MLRSKLSLKDGKFYKDGEVVPLEFGNWEQIRLIKEKQELMAAIKGDGLVLDVYVEEIKTYQVKSDFKCVSCDKVVWIEEDVDEKDDKDCIVRTHSCWHCKAKYEVSKNNEGDFIVKLKNS